MSDSMQSKYKNEFQKLVCVNHPQYLEVSRVHSQSEGMQLTKGQKTPSQIVDFAHSISNSTHHNLSMVLHWARAGLQVLPVGKVGLGDNGFTSSDTPEPHTFSSITPFRKSVEFIIRVLSSL
uniref:Uncharacterized protein n=1 Tax=Stegastes partitus TaxID=144197 RepID=A0A3B5ANS8_9TELE